MENLTPSLACLYFSRRYMSQGKSLRETLAAYVQESSDGFASSLSIWLSYFDADRLDALPNLNLTSDIQSSLLECFEAGLRGQPILRQLERLTEEAEAASALEVDEYLVKLPFKALLPVFSFQLPAFLLLIFGPVLSQMSEGIRYVS